MIPAWIAVVLLLVATVIGLWTGRQRERARQAADHEHSSLRLKLVLWSTGDELWEMDLAADTLSRSNPLKHLQASSHDLVTRASAMRALVHPDDRDAFNEAMVLHFKGDTEYFDISYRAPDLAGSWRWLRSRGRVVERQADGQALRMVGTTSDVTEFKNHELELDELNHELESRVEQRTEALDRSNRELQDAIVELQQAQDQLVHSEKMAALGGLVAGVAHEINTPLGIGVTAASHLDQETRRLAQQIEDGSLTREALGQFRQMATESAQLILRNLMRADKLVRSFKQVAVDQSSEERRRIDLGVYLQEVQTSLLPAMKKSTHRMEVECPTALVVDTYPGAIYQIVANLVMNSLLHGFRDRQDGLITLTASREGDEILMVYRDNGVGMDEETCRRVFEPFFTTRRGEGGSGLGMHIVWNLATSLLGGGLQCESAPGKGVRFELRFPAAA
ncbi:sensor histidine kinase [Arenimonas sp.]|uniref:sensor histidine kinase n=1 Tax=Arenimonas sp. TaxID=1872635 RepID=UPI0039E72517